VAIEDGACLTASALRRRLPLALSETYGRGRTIVFRGELLSRVYLIERGRVRASYETGAGTAALALRAGDIFAEIGALEGLPSDALVEAASSQVVVLGIPVESLRALLGTDEPLRRLFLERVAERRTALGAALLGWSGFNPAVTRPGLWPS
jgi:CRP-like cAMP-binding protein